MGVCGLFGGRAGSEEESTECENRSAVLGWPVTLSCMFPKPEQVARALSLFVFCVLLFQGTAWALRTGISHLRFGSGWTGPLFETWQSWGVIVGSQVVGFGVPSIVCLFVLRNTSTDTSSLGSAEPVTERLGTIARHMAAGSLLGGVLFYVLSFWLAPIWEPFVRLSEQERAFLSELLAPKTGLRPVWADLFAFALVPAVCEELLFRGALLRLLWAKEKDSVCTDGSPQDRCAQKARVYVAVLLCAGLFALVHGSAGRFLPTLCLGVAFGVAASASGSVLLAIAMHGQNNLLVVLLARRGVWSVSEVRPAIKWAFLPCAALAAWFAMRLVLPTLRFRFLMSKEGKKENGS